MNFLAFETTTSRASVAARNSLGQRAYRSSDNPKSHSEFLNQAIQECLEECRLSMGDINQILTTVGPGSFTGIRVAQSAAKALAYCLNLKIKFTNSLVVLHQSTEIQNQIVLLNAQKDMVFVSLRRMGKIWSEPRLMRISEIENLVFENFGEMDQVEPLGAGFLDYSGFWSDRLISRMTSPSPITVFPAADILLNIAEAKPELLQTLEWKSLNPLYLRASAAEEKEVEKLK